MGHYAYKGTAELGSEPAGGSDKMIWRHYKTDAGALRAARRVFGDSFRLYRFTNIYDNATFTEIEK